MSEPPNNVPQAPLWRKRLLVTEFSALAVLLISMFILTGAGEPDSPVSPAWLLIPAIASLAVFLSFLGLMYLRWIAEAGGHASLRSRLVFGLLALTLLGLWAFGIANTWSSLAAG